MKLVVLGLTTVVLLPFAAWADEDEIEKQEPRLEEASKKPDYEAKLKERYSLNDVELKKLHDDGMNDSQITIAAQLAKSSGKSIDQIEKMRVDEKMGWGKIAKTLGVAPKEIGQSIASMHRGERAEKVDKKDKDDRRKDRAEKKAEHAEKKAERAEQREEKKH